MKKTILLFTLLVLIKNSNVYSQNFWQPISDPSFGASTSAMIVAKNGNIVANASGWFRYSSNNGSTWNLSTGSNSNTSVHKLIVTANGDIYGNADRLIKSTDNGISWSDISSFRFSNSITDFAINSNGYIFAVMNGIIFKSIDHGSSWDTLSKAFIYPAAISIAISSDNIMFIGTNPWGSGGKIYRSTDNGVNWTSMAGSTFSSTSITLIEINNNNEIYIGTEGMGLSRSLDKGITWTDINSGIPGTNSWISDIVFNNSSGVVFVSVDYMGVFSSSDKGNSWSNISSGLKTSGGTVANPTALAINSSGILFAGTNDFGTYRSTSLPSGISDAIAENIQIKNYPNPAKNNVTFEITLGYSFKKNLNLLFTNSSGRTVKQVSISSSVQNIPLDDLPQGVYSYILQSDSEVLKTGKIIKVL